MNEDQLKSIIVLLTGRIPRFILILSVWLITIFSLNEIGVLNDVDPNILLVVHLGAFFFALTTSPIAWIIKGLGIEVGSNTPDHLQVDKTLKEDGKESSVIVRDYGSERDDKKLNRILDEQTKNW